MNGESRLQLRPVVVIAGAVLLIAAGAAATYFILRPAASGSSSAPPNAGDPGSAQLQLRRAATVTLSPDAIKRAGIEVQPVSSSSVAAGLRVPGTVQPNAYRTTVVTSLVGGRITRVSAELGQPVRRGQTLAEVYSPELAEAQTRFVASRAELEAHERELRRTERLVEIGAASRQELEKIHAEHTAELMMVQSNRSRLTLLGMTEAQVEALGSSSKVTATAAISSPLEGAVTAREANVGMNVDPSVPLFTVADLSTVWIVGDLNERDLGRVRVGSPVIIAAAALPDARREGKISYIDPQIKADTRTAQIRVEIPNPGRQLRLGMFVDMEVGEGTSQMAMTVPRSAVQMVGDRSVVYVANPAQPGQFVERIVETGRAAGDSIEVVKGIQAGDSIVVKGSFAVRAERERLGTRAAPDGSAKAEPHPVGRNQVEPNKMGSGFSQTSIVRIVVSEKGFEPSRISLRAGEPARLSFIRTTDATCATEVAIPSLNIKRALPLNQAVEISFTPEKPGDVAFACGMAMFSGTLVVQ